MRNIKFRAWVQDSCMVDVELIDWHEKYIVHEDLAWTDMGAPEPKEPDCVTEFKDLTLMQYTGLKDKNGTEIYEGDVIRYNETNFDYPDMGKVSAIEFDSGSFVPVSEGYCVEIEVIGNIHENPELLNV